MRQLIAVFLLGLSCSFPVAAGDGSVRVSIFGGIVSSTLAVTFSPATLTQDSEESTRGSHKKGDQKIIAARNDAAAFVASDGYIRGPNLEAAFEVLRTRNELGTTSDIKLAQAVLVYEFR